MVKNFNLIGNSTASTSVCPSVRPSIHPSDAGTPWCRNVLVPKRLGAESSIGISAQYLENTLMECIWGMLNTDQPKKKALFPRFAAEHPLREKKMFSRRKIKINFPRGFSPRNFTEKLRKSSRRDSARFRGETPRNFAMGR